MNEEAKSKLQKHTIGMDLDSISAEELRERISLLEGEIARLEIEILKKFESRDAAESFFRN